MPELIVLAILNIAPQSYRVEILQRQTVRVDRPVTPGARLDLLMLKQPFAHCQALSSHVRLHLTRVRRRGIGWVVEQHAEQVLTALHWLGPRAVSAPEMHPGHPHQPAARRIRGQFHQKP